MRAITIESPGGPEVLRLTDVTDPVPAAGEVVIANAAAGVNRADLMQRQGFYPPPPGASPYLGLECAGRIIAVGEGVDTWQVGDEVCALLAGGGYADQVAVSAGHVLPLPSGTTLTQAASLPEVACTVYSNVLHLSGLARGETFLVHGGASGIGTFAIQLGVALGAKVACTAGSRAKLDRCRELGAELAIPYRDEDFVEAVTRFTDGHGADVILDIMGASYLQRNLAALAINGRLAIIGLQGGARTEVDLSLMLRKRVTVRATTLRARPTDEKAAIVAGVNKIVWPLVSDGQIRPVIDSIFPLAQAADAHKLMEADTHVGKILLAT